MTIDITPTNDYRKIFTLDEEQLLPTDRPYLYHVCFLDWTDQAHHHIMHMHKDMVEIVLFLKGHGQYTVGQTRYQVEAGDVILCNSQISHDEFPSTDVPYRNLCIGIKQLNLPGLLPNQIISEFQNPYFHSPREFHDLLQLMLMIERYASEKSDNFQELCNYLMLSVVKIVQQMIRNNTTKELAKENHICSRIETYINTHYTENLSLEQLSKQFFISPYHLSHIFKEKTGYTIKHYILRRRIGEAQTLLSDSQKSIQAIAHECGFDDSLYFSRIFTKYIGLSPSEYRNTRKNE